MNSHLALKELNFEEVMELLSKLSQLPVYDKIIKFSDQVSLSAVISRMIECIDEYINSGDIDESKILSDYEIGVLVSTMSRLPIYIINDEADVYEMSNALVILVRNYLSLVGKYDSMLNDTLSAISKLLIIGDRFERLISLSSSLLETESVRNMNIATSSMSGLFKDIIYGTSQDFKDSECIDKND